MDLNSLFVPKHSNRASRPACQPGPVTSLAGEGLPVHSPQVKSMRGDDTFRHVIGDGSAIAVGPVACAEAFLRARSSFARNSRAYMASAALSADPPRQIPTLTAAVAPQGIELAALMPQKTHWVVNGFTIYRMRTPLCAIPRVSFQFVCSRLER
jgi:hypothetical protein